MSKTSPYSFLMSKAGQLLPETLLAMQSTSTSSPAIRGKGRSCNLTSRAASEHKILLTCTVVHLYTCSVVQFSCCKLEFLSICNVVHFYCCKIVLLYNCSLVHFTALQFFCFSFTVLQYTLVFFTLALIHTCSLHCLYIR